VLSCKYRKFAAPKKKRPAERGVSAVTTQNKTPSKTGKRILYSVDTSFFELACE